MMQAGRSAVRFSQEAFELLVAQALEGLPQEVQEMLDNVVVTVQSLPTKREQAELGLQGPYALLGVYYGIPQTEREGYNLSLPDRIVLFQRPIEAVCATDAEVVEEVRRTVLHELAHHFGIDDERLEELGLE
ncbi:MAG: metallopeptidase family protein [Dehalococcoidia bacterium]|nr:metallopeptidase family protein [Dehalococcoidia bacterium]